MSDKNSRVHTQNNKYCIDLIFHILLYTVSRQRDENTLCAVVMAGHPDVAAQLDGAVETKSKYVVTAPATLAAAEQHDSQDEGSATAPSRVLTRRKGFSQPQADQLVHPLCGLGRGEASP